MQTRKPETALRALARAVANMRETVTDEAGQVMLPGVDTLARLTAISADLDKLTDAVKAETKAAMEARGVKQFTGAVFICERRESVRATIDTARLRAEMPDVAAAYERETPQVSLHFKTRGA